MTGSFHYNSRVFGDIHAPSGMTVTDPWYVKDFFAWLDSSEKLTFYTQDPNHPKIPSRSRLGVDVQWTQYIISTKLFLTLMPRYIKDKLTTSSNYENLQTIVSDIGKSLLVESLWVLSLAENIKTPIPKIDYDINFLPPQAYIRDSISNFFSTVNQRQENRILFLSLNEKGKYSVALDAAENEITLEQFIRACGQHYDHQNQKNNIRAFQEICDLYKIHLREWKK